MSKPWEVPTNNTDNLFTPTQTDSTYPYTPTSFQNQPVTSEQNQVLNQQSGDPQSQTLNGELNPTGTLATNTGMGGLGGYSSYGGMGYGGMGMGMGMGFGGMGMGYGGMGMMNMDPASNIYKAFRVIESAGFMINCFTQFATSMEQNTEGRYLVVGSIYC